MTEYVNICIARHKATFNGLFAKWRTTYWWKKHDRCTPT